MHANTPAAIRREDYTSYGYQVTTIDLDFALYLDHTRVCASMVFSREGDKAGEDLYLYGEELELLSVVMDGKELMEESYSVDPKGLTLHDPPREFTLVVTTRIYPDKNLALEGLYRSGGMYCTQCEAEGFRKITYYPDRPDVLSVFTVRLEANQEEYPVLLANGDLKESGSLEGGRHFALWHDPYPKPSYLFALVAGKLALHEDVFLTASKKEVQLKLYVEERNVGLTDHAMESLKRAMAWDEEVFGLEYDLATYMIVAVDDFNMGAMENKGLNIFNSKYVLCSLETATDQDFLNVEGVIAHEYFHNWTGNRVTCRDWFQLSLKEGLTVFRDQEFSADMNSRAVKRIEDVRLLRNVQFKEDASPMAHPVRPDSYYEINNFYTATVYNKGAEVIRMMHTLLGKDGFRKGMDLYFKRHDGAAVTCDDFVAAMEDATGVDLNQFKLWYSQSGTPQLTVSSEWDGKDKTLRLKFKQDCPDTAGQKNKKPFVIPVRLGLLNSGGQSLALGKEGDLSTLLVLTEKEEEFVFNDVGEKPILSVLRDFTAPVKITPFLEKEELAILAGHDPNLFSRWDSSARLTTEVILEAEAAFTRKENPLLDKVYTGSLAARLAQETEDKAFLALSLKLPLETDLIQEVELIRPAAIHLARRFVLEKTAQAFTEDFLRIYRENQAICQSKGRKETIASRSLKNIALGYLMALTPLPKEILDLCLLQFSKAETMTDVLAALSFLAATDAPEKKDAFASFYLRWKENPLVLDSWFAIQATADHKDVFDRVLTLMDHEAFSMGNPNKIRSLIGSFCSLNHAAFHRPDGKGYSFLADQIEKLNRLNPQIAARLVGPLVNFRRYEKNQRELMKGQLQRIMDHKELSSDVYEIVAKSLNG